jgi:hypothetical protein
VFDRARLYITLTLMAALPVLGFIALITYDGK